MFVPSPSVAKMFQFSPPKPFYRSRFYNVFSSDPGSSSCRKFLIGLGVSPRALPVNSDFLAFPSRAPGPPLFFCFGRF